VYGAIINVYTSHRSFKRSRRTFLPEREREREGVNNNVAANKVKEATSFFFFLSFFQRNVIHFSPIFFFFQKIIIYFIYHLFPYKIIISNLFRIAVFIKGNLKVEVSFMPFMLLAKDLFFYGCLVILARGSVLKLSFAIKTAKLHLTRSKRMFWPVAVYLDCRNEAPSKCNSLQVTERA
jgi:hypothetical protein